MLVSMELGHVTVAESDRLDGQDRTARWGLGDVEVVVSLPGAVAVEDDGGAPLGHRRNLVQRRD
jgi:hypothetical protein